jgi:hypothetical protein
MGDSDRTDERPGLRVELELHLDRQPVIGRLRAHGGADEAFVGWLGFVDALKRLQDDSSDRREQR